MLLTIWKAYRAVTRLVVVVHAAGVWYAKVCTTLLAAPVVSCIASRDESEERQAQRRHCLVEYYVLPVTGLPNK